MSTPDTPARPAARLGGGRCLTPVEARRVYDLFGSRQDGQGWYEDPPVAVLVRQAVFGDARSVVEVGCGTGRLARELLAGTLPADATYRGFDNSPTMVELARERLEPWSDRARVELTDGSMDLPLTAGSCDRFVANYLADLLSAEAIVELVAEAARALAPGGLLGLVSLTFGTGLASRAVSFLWGALHRRRPEAVGGCRPIELLPFVDPTRFRPRHRETVVALGIASEVLVAERLGSG